MTYSAREHSGPLAFLAIAGMLLAYGVYQFRGYRAGPTVAIHTPAQGARLESPRVVVTGIARNITHLELNGRTIYTAEDSTFSEQLLLPPGYSILQVTATDKFGREKRLEHHVISPPRPQ